VSICNNDLKLFTKELTAYYMVGATCVNPIWFTACNFTNIIVSKSMSSTCSHQIFKSQTYHFVKIGKINAEVINRIFFALDMRRFI